MIEHQSLRTRYGKKGVKIVLFIYDVNRSVNGLGWLKVDTIWIVEIRMSTNCHLDWSKLTYIYTKFDATKDQTV